MNILFVTSVYSGLGIEYLSACLKEAGHTTDLVFDPRLFNDGEVEVPILAKIFSYHNKVVREIIEKKPDLIVFSVVSDHYKWALSIAKDVKEKVNTPVLFGGIHPTSVPELVITEDPVDMICIGEGEKALVELADSSDGTTFDTSIRNIWFKKNGVIIKNEIRPLMENLDDLPFPDKDLFIKEASLFTIGYGIMTARGCPFHCSYCNNSYLQNLYRGQGKYLRRRSVSNVIQELKYAKQKYKPKFIRFHDEIFTYDKKWLIEFTKEYKLEINLPYFCWVHHKFVDDDTVKILKDSGCYEVQMGVQTISEDLNKTYLDRVLDKEKLKKAIQLFKKYKIWIVTDNIFGLPHQGEKELQDLALFYSDTLPDRMDIFYLRYYPKTKIVNYAYNEGLLSEDDVSRLNESKDVKTFTTGGDFSNNTLFLKFQFLLNSFRFYPSWLRQLIIQKRLYRFFPNLPPFLSRVVLRLFNQSKYDMYRKRHFRRYWNYGLRKLIFID